jgi:hypothetical protein
MERKAYTRYSREFKLEAVRLAAIGERPKADNGERSYQLVACEGFEPRSAPRRRQIWALLGVEATTKLLGP